MLQNEREYQNTKIQLARMEEAYREAEAKLAEPSDVPAIVRQGHLNGIGLVVGDLRVELTDYERLRAGEVKSLVLDSVLSELPNTLVSARLARGWTQKELAKALSTSEQQVQKDEAGGYQKASLDRLLRVAETLGVSIKGRARMPRPTQYARPSSPKNRPVKVAA